MYLSRLELDIRNIFVRNALTNCQEMHKLIMRGFQNIESNEARKEMGALYRVVSNTKCVLVYVQSKVKPCWENEKSNAINYFEVKDTSKIIECFEVGRIYNFNILTFPFKRTNNKRYFLRNANERLEWLQRKAEQSGFQILSVREEDNGVLQGIKGERNTGFSTINYIGTLKVTDKELFIKAYTNGLGVEKAYGLGLLLLSI